MLVLITGPPGAGKSTLAESLSPHLGHAAVLGWDWGMAALRQFPEVQHAVEQLDRTDYRTLGWRIAWSFANAQLRAGRSVILDGVARDAEVATTVALADRLNRAHLVVALACSDLDLARARIETRSRGIPGWDELSWESASRTIAGWSTPSAADLVIDTAEAADPAAIVLEHLAGR